MDIITKMSEPSNTTEVFDMYWHVADERQRMFFRKQSGFDVLTNDEILRDHRFTNAYRSSDRVSQYLIKHVLFEGNQYEDELFFRCILFKIFNKIESWEKLSAELGRPIEWCTYNYNDYDAAITRITGRGFAFYNSAYMHPSPIQVGGVRYSRKHQCHLKTIEMMMSSECPKRIQQATKFEDVYLIMLEQSMVGEFLAYQYATDLNYSTICNFSENDFTRAGPGAIDGISKCFRDKGDYSCSDIIRWLQDKQEEEFEKRGIKFLSLFGRPLQLIDIQNLFCETDKYARVAAPHIKGSSDRIKIKQKYTKRQKPVSLFYPPKWGINHLLDVLPDKETLAL